MHVPPCGVFWKMIPGLTRRQWQTTPLQNTDGRMVPRSLHAAMTQTLLWAFGVTTLAQLILWPKMCFTMVRMGIRLAEMRMPRWRSMIAQMGTHALSA